jgi:carbon monoxide dehydrogenase subunit G
MALKIAGNMLVDATRDEVWKLIFDLDFIKPIIDEIPGVGVERLVQVSEDKYEGTATIGVAMIKGKYDGTITVLEKRAPEYVKVRGDGKGGGNWTSGELSLTLTEQDGKTLMTYAGTGNLSGPLASVGQRLIDTVGKQFIAHGTKTFADQLAARSREMERQAMNAKPAAET